MPCSVYWSLSSLEQISSYPDGFRCWQGAAVAAAFCAEQELQQEESQKTEQKSDAFADSQTEPPEASRSDMTTTISGVCSAGRATQADSEPSASQKQHIAPNGGIKFAILCSGYRPCLPAFELAMQNIGRISMPSLHIFGSRVSDYQVDALESCRLRDCFAEDSAVTLQHTNRGHCFPADKRSMLAYREFLVNLSR